MFSPHLLGRSVELGNRCTYCLGVLLLIVFSLVEMSAGQTITLDALNDWMANCDRALPSKAHMKADTTTDVLNNTLHRTKIDRYITVTDILDGTHFHVMCVSFTLEGPRRDKYERAFQKKTRMSVWEKVLFTYATIAGTPLQEVYVFGPRFSVCDCFGAHIENGHLETGDQVCQRLRKMGIRKMARSDNGLDSPDACGVGAGLTAGLGIPIPALRPHRLLLPRGIALPKNVSLLECTSTMDAITDSLHHYFAERNGKLTVLGKTDIAAEIHVRGLRSEVIQKGNDWEKLGLYLVVSTTQEHGRSQTSLFLYLDGYTASGLGDYPPDSAFTTSMEPEHYKDLSEYAKQLATRIQDDIQRCGAQQ